MILWYLSLFSLWLGPILSFYTAFLHQSSYFFSLLRAMVGHFSALLLLSVLRHCSPFGLEVIWPGKSRHCTCVGEGHCPVALCEGGGLPAAYSREWVTLLRHSPWLWLVVLSREWWILADQIRATGWTHRHWIFTELTWIVFYCQIIMTILANITKKL